MHSAPCTASTNSHKVATFNRNYIAYVRYAKNYALWNWEHMKLACTHLCWYRDVPPGPTRVPGWQAILGHNWPNWPNRSVYTSVLWYASKTPRVNPGHGSLASGSGLGSMSLTRFHLCFWGYCIFWLYVLIVYWWNIFLFGMFCFRQHTEEITFFLLSNLWSFNVDVSK